VGLCSSLLGQGRPSEVMPVSSGQIVEGYETHQESSTCFTYLLTYLCGTTTNIWLRPVEEDLSMTACLEHRASNL
jgi:hypothetical protein